MTNPRPVEERLGEYYEFDNYISHSDTKEGFVSKCYHIVRKWNIKHKTSLLVEKKGKLVEIGSGTGKLFAKCKEVGWDVKGIEPSAEARRIAKETNGIELLKNLDEADIKDSSIDTVMLWHVLEHIPNLNQTFEAINKLLKDDGKLIVAVPNSKAYDAIKYQENRAGYDVPRHLSHFQNETLRRIAKKYNFRVTKVKPMWFDSFYTSLLSEKIKSGKLNYIKGFSTGLRSNLKAMLKTGEFSSLIFIFEKKRGKSRDLRKKRLSLEAYGI
jgi:2-polyprenyl-3-methyl-5-hydroxy-6-metoxy-1,4-benzoquinol methylase